MDLTATILVLMAALGPVPELTEAQRIQLQSAVDRQAQFDGPAIFPLLRNALQWPVPAQRAGATIPDYAAIAAAPAEHRGRLFLIEGKLARVVPMGLLAQPGLWDGNLKEWDIVVGAEPAQTVVVFLADPPADPPVRSRVEVLARFYMVMRRGDETHGEPTDFPVFVGRTSRIVRAGASSPRPASPPLLLLLLVLALAAGYWFVRRSVRQHAAGVGASRHAQATSPDAEPVGSDDADQTLASDPADALEQLARGRSGDDVDQRDRDD